MDYGAFPNVNKVCLYSCVQYLDNEGLKGLLKSPLTTQKHLGIHVQYPGQTKIWDYYNTEQKRLSILEL